MPNASSNITVAARRRLAWGFETVSDDVMIEGGRSLSTTYGYYTNALDTNNYSRLQTVQYPGGDWVNYTYEAAGRKQTVMTPFKDSLPGTTHASQVMHYTYAGDAALAPLGFPAADTAMAHDRRPRLTVETLCGAEVSRTYHAYLADRHETWLSV